MQEPRIAAAFFDTIRLLAAGASVGNVEELIEQGRIEEIADEIGLTAPQMAILAESTRAAYISGGSMESESLVTNTLRRGRRLMISFDVRNPRAEAWLRRYSSELVTAIISDQREAIRIAVSEGTAAGRGPRQTALDIVGRISRVTGRRSGGIVGLTSQQARYVASARAELLSGDPERIANYLDRKLRDRRFDGLARRALANGKPVLVKDVDRMTGRYADRLLKMRGDTIARTEALEAFSAGRNEAVEQLIDSGIDANNVTKIWRTAGDSRTRETHAGMNRQKKPFRQPFRSPSGALLMHPGDRSLGAGAAEVIQCRCISETKIDFISEAANG